MSRILGQPLNVPWRWVVIVAALVASVAHVPVIAPHLDEAPYMGCLLYTSDAADDVYQV